MFLDVSLVPVHPGTGSKRRNNYDGSGYKLTVVPFISFELHRTTITYYFHTPGMTE